ncbi:hypothetical protein KM043_010988 [Ampulex compressa]|nr:hypothetical protein KM043_010988 [Ampulex compressa]
MRFTSALGGGWGLGIITRSKVGKGQSDFHGGAHGRGLRGALIMRREVIVDTLYRVKAPETWELEEKGKEEEEEEKEEEEEGRGGKPGSAGLLPLIDSSNGRGSN